MESRDVLGSLAYACSRPDARDMSTALFSRCLGCNSTLHAMKSAPQAFVRSGAWGAEPVDTKTILTRQFDLAGLPTKRIEDLYRRVALRTTSISPHPDTTYVFPSLDAAAPGAVSGIQTGGYSNKVKLASTNGSLDSLQRVKSGQGQFVDIGLSPIYSGWEFTDGILRMMTGSTPIAALGAIRAFTHVALPLACLISMLSALACGIINAVFIVKLKVPSLIVTLGTASLYLGIAELISSSTSVSASSKTFSDVALHNVLGLPLCVCYDVVLAAVFAYVPTWMPLGRHIVFVGANREVARLAGINVDRIRAGSYIVASLVAGLAGILLVMSVGGFDPTASAPYLLPALAAVFLRTAIVLPGQFNPMGTFFGIYFLENGIIGPQLLGYTGWVHAVPPATGTAQPDDLNQAPASTSNVGQPGQRTRALKHARSPT